MVIVRFYKNYNCKMNKLEVYTIISFLLNTNSSEIINFVLRVFSKHIIFKV